MRYTETVMDHFMNPRNCGQLADADGVGTLGSDECGDVLRVWITVRDGKLKKVHHEVFGCPAAIASCSMMTELATGMTIQQARDLTDADVAAALGGLPEPKYHCSNLAASALHKAIDEYAASQKNPDDTVTITMLINNEMPAPLKSEHGLSFWIQFGGKNILFDTGQSDALIHNADLLDIDLSKTDTVVLSHGHYDHTGGLSAILDIAPDAEVYLHPDAAKMRYSCHPDKAAKEISMPQAACEKLAACAAKGRVTYTNKPRTLGPTIMATGPIPRLTDYEDVGGPFYLDSQCQTPDPLNDDQALLIATSKGLVVILGCAHAGVINTLEYAAALKNQPIDAVIGGMHLKTAPAARLSKTCESIRKFDIKQLIPCHCTGKTAADALKQSFPSRFRDLQTGIRITI
jgi:7,8-dihydropterin-6-yl-methyl-4-(beta-D-ribofuranosyl)aminobenzene 5'-phosphate synthase